MEGRLVLEQPIEIRPALPVKMKTLARERVFLFYERVDVAGIEFLLIDEHTWLEEFKNQLRWNEAAFR